MSSVKIHPVSVKINCGDKKKVLYWSVNVFISAVKNRHFNMSFVGLDSLLEQASSGHTRNCSFSALAPCWFEVAAWLANTCLPSHPALTVTRVWSPTAAEENVWLSSRKMSHFFSSAIRNTVDETAETASSKKKLDKLIQHSSKQNAQNALQRKVTADRKHNKTRRNNCVIQQS